MTEPNWTFSEESTETGKNKNDLYENLWKDVYNTLISEKVAHLYQTTNQESKDEQKHIRFIKNEIFLTHSTLIEFFQHQKLKSSLKNSAQLKDFTDFTATLKTFLNTVESESGKLWLALFQQILKKIEKITSFGDPEVEVITKDEKPDGLNKWEIYNGIKVQRLNDSSDGAVNYNIELDLRFLNSSPKREDQFDKTIEILGSFFYSKLIPKKYKYTLNIVNPETVSVDGKDKTIAESMIDIISLLSAKMYNLKTETQKIAYHSINKNKIMLTTRPVSQDESDRWKEAMKIFSGSFKKK